MAVLADAGRNFAAIGVEVADSGATPSDEGEPSATAPGSERPEGKLGHLLDAVSRPEGATLEELAISSGWLPHTTRAAITRLRQRGFDVHLETVEGRKAYHLDRAG